MKLSVLTLVAGVACIGVTTFVITNANSNFQTSAEARRNFQGMFLRSGESGIVLCNTNLNFKWETPGKRLRLDCSGGNITSTSSPRPTTSSTSQPNPTNPPSQPTNPPSQPTTPPGQIGSIFGPTIDPVSLGTCTAATHDKYVVVDGGVTYRTWHPRQDPQTGCVFAHEHGDDPSRSNITNIPAVRFGYWDAGVEPHEGFKINVVNAGDKNNEGSTAFNSTRIVAHQGTGGAKRFTTRYHSLEVAFQGGNDSRGKHNGQKFFTGGLADTGSSGSICQTRVGKTVMQTDCNESSDYEIWSFNLSGIVVSWAVFDPITERRPSDNAALTLSGNKGCKHEVYGGPFNREIGTYRPAFGQLPGGIGYLATYKGGNTSEPQSQFKITRPACDFYSSIGAKN